MNTQAASVANHHSPLTLAMAGLLLCGSQLNLANAADNQLLGGEITGKLTFASDYVFRGESETVDGEVPVVQGTLNWGNAQGWYAGVFASNIKFQDPNLEIVTAPYIGKAGNFGDSGFSYDVMVFSYLYPGASYSNYTELWLRVAKQFDQAKVQLEVTPTLDDWFGVKDWSGVNYAIHPSYQFSNGFNVSGSYGYQDLSGPGAEGWGHWNIGVSKRWASLDFDLRYHGSTVAGEHLVYGGQTEIFDDRLVIGVSKSF